MSIRDNSPEGQRNRQKIVEKALENWKQGMEPKANAVHVKREREYEQSIEDLKKMLPISPSEDKTAEHKECLRVLELHLGSDYYQVGQFHNNISNAMTEYGNLCRNKAIEEAIEFLKSNQLDKGFKVYLNSLISELNKLKV